MCVYLFACRYLNQVDGKKKSSGEVAPAAKVKGKSKKKVVFEVDEDYVVDDAVEDEAGQPSSESDDDFDMSKVSLLPIFILYIYFCEMCTPRNNLVELNCHIHLNFLVKFIFCFHFLWSELS